MENPLDIYEQLKKDKLTIVKEKTVQDFFSMLLSSRTQAHIFHLQCQSLSAHLALKEYYESIIEFTDSLIESYQGVNGIVFGYKNCDLEDFKGIEAVVGYFKNLYKFIEDYNVVFTKSEHLNIVDEIKALVSAIIYKLENLQ